jgi:hypothetical protein|tara:strand:- start:265 stop:480 length:216 start_codon:yes stop_codon:yes gene_type:complete
MLTLIHHQNENNQHVKSIFANIFAKEQAFVNQPKSLPKIKTVAEVFSPRLDSSRFHQNNLVAQHATFSQGG